MNGKLTAVQWLKDKLFELEIKIDFKTHEEAFFIFEEAKQMEKEQMIKFAQIVIDNTCGDYDGNVVILKPIEDIYNETYGK
jgi:hypothetical protein